MSGKEIIESLECVRDVSYLFTEDAVAARGMLLKSHLDAYALHLLGTIQVQDLETLSPANKVKMVSDLIKASQMLSVQPAAEDCDPNAALDGLGRVGQRKIKKKEVVEVEHE